MYPWNLWNISIYVTPLFSTYFSVFLFLHSLTLFFSCSSLWSLSLLSPSPSNAMFHFTFSFLLSFFHSFTLFSYSHSPSLSLPTPFSLSLSLSLSLSPLTLRCYGPLSLEEEPCFPHSWARMVVEMLLCHSFTFCNQLLIQAHLAKWAQGNGTKERESTYSDTRKRVTTTSAVLAQYYFQALIWIKVKAKHGWLLISYQNELCVSWFGVCLLLAAQLQY